MKSELTWTQTQNLVDALVFQVRKKHLGSSEVQVLHRAWDGKTYDAIAFSTTSNSLVGR
ncbi:MAG: hypothetical protein KME38_09385 [Spirirestis rafaelensis WJT71-NPBG6]|jgi:hypothetical protein|nr:hypothetical protein [Spirirestis rafaelensis WJT71-NPBG6]